MNYDVCRWMNILQCGAYSSSIFVLFVTIVLSLTFFFSFKKWIKVDACKFISWAFLSRYVMNVLIYMFSSVWLSGCWEMLLSEKDSSCIYAASVGVTAEVERPEESGCSSRKRARKEGLGGGFFDLNLPAEFLDRN